MSKSAIVTVAIAASVILAADIGGCSPSPQPIELQASAEPSPTVRPYQDSPFGFHPAYVVGSGYEYASDIGVRWDRPPLYCFWFKVQRNLSENIHDWTDYDQLFGRVPEDMHVMANIGTVPTALLMSLPPPAARSLPAERLAQEQELARQYVRDGSYLPTDEESYRAFVRACVERYDGDSISDMAGLTNPIRYWQVGNEPPRGLTDYAEFLRITYEAIKDADPKAMVVIGGVPGMPPVTNYLRDFDRSYLPILEELAGFEGQYFDIFDIHWYGNATVDYRGLGEVHAYITQKLDVLGLSPPGGYWVTEMGTYSGEPVEAGFSFQSERQQARDMVKRYVYALSLGIKKVFLAFGLMEGFHHSDGYFDHTGLVYDGKGSNDAGPGVKKLSYYTYKKMVEVLERSDWVSIQIIREEDGIYIYKLTNQGKPIWVVWNDNDQPETVSITLDENINTVRITEAVPKYESGKAVTDYYRAFNELQGKIIPSYPAQLQFEIGTSPVFIEEGVQE